FGISFKIGDTIKRFPDAADDILFLLNLGKFLTFLSEHAVAAIIAVLGISTSLFEALKSIFNLLELKMKESITNRIDPYKIEHTIEAAMRLSFSAITLLTGILYLVVKFALHINMFALSVFSFAATMPMFALYMVFMIKNAYIYFDINRTFKNSG